MFPLYSPQYIGLPPLKPSFTMDFPMIVENHHDITIESPLKSPLNISLSHCTSLFPISFWFIHFILDFPRDLPMSFPSPVVHVPRVPQVPRTAFATRRKARSRGSLIALSSSAVAWDGWPWLVRLGKMVKVVMFVGKSREKDGFYGTFHGKIHGKWWRDGNCMRSMENDAFWCWFCGDVLEFLVGISMEISWNIMRILTIKL